MLPDKIQDTELNLKYLGHWECNRQEGQGSPEEKGCKCQTFFLSPLSIRRKQTTSVRFFSLKILCCHDDTWFHLNLTFLKPWTNNAFFLMEMFFLSYVNETMYLLWNLPFFKIIPPKTNFFSFLKPWADNSSTNQYLYQLFYGWEMTYPMPSYLKNAHCGTGAWWNSISLEASLLSD